MSVYLQCRVCRNPVVKEDHLVDSNKSEFKECDNSTVWYIRDDNMPDWVSEAVKKESWQKGKLCCPKCNGKLGSFNFIKILTCQQCDKHELPPVHILKDRVDKKILAVKANSSTSPDNMQTNASSESMEQGFSPLSESMDQVFTPSSESMDHVFTPSSESMDQVFTPSSESMDQVFIPSSEITKCVFDSLCDRINHDETNTCSNTINHNGTNTCSNTINHDGTNMCSNMINHDGTNTCSNMINHDGTNTCSNTINHDRTIMLGDQVVNTNAFPEIVAQHKTDVTNHDRYLIDNNDKSLINDDDMIDQVDDGGSDNDFDDMNSDFCPEDFIKIRDGEILYEPTFEQKRTNFDPYKEMSQNNLDGFPVSSKDHHVDKTVIFSCLTVVDENGLTANEDNLEHNQDQSTEKLDRVQDYGQNTMAMSFKTNCDTFQMHPRPIGNEHTSTFDISDQMNNLKALSDPHIQSGSNLELSNDPHIQSGSGEGNTVTNNAHHLLQNLSSTAFTETSQITNRTSVEETNDIQVDQQTNETLTEPFGTYQENRTHSEHQHFISTNADILTEEFESESVSSQVQGDSRLQRSVDSIIEDQSLFEESPVPDGEDVDIDVDIPVDFLMLSERSRRRRPNRRSRRENKGKR
ncbi:protein PF3D7_1417600-like [Mytilus californianus]|uniref:protein PF3D7_1417600-like n=1 Tax=Mytilus californianus TaxID=6549 RepID=UPI00224543CE|nr:protein PF3D7_1417600-like [Mytilus californianus]